MNQSFGILDISYSNRFDPYCNWIVGNAGIPQAVAIVSISQMNFSDYGRYITFFSYRIIRLKALLSWRPCLSGWRPCLRHNNHQLLLVSVMCGMEVFTVRLVWSSGWGLVLVNDHTIRATYIYIHGSNHLLRNISLTEVELSPNKTFLHIFTVTTWKYLTEMARRFLLDMDGIPLPLIRLRVCKKLPLKTQKISRYRSLSSTSGVLLKYLTAPWRNLWI